MNKVLKIIAGCLFLYGLLYWAVNNPKSASNVKEAIDHTASEAVDRAKDITDNLTDEE